MSEPVTAQVNGLQHSNNTFTASPPGSLEVADNVIINSKGVGEPRNGQNRWRVLATAADLVNAMADFDGTLVAQYGSSRTDVTQGLAYDNGSTMTPYSGSYNPVDCNGAATDYARMKFALAGGYLQFCTQAGPKTLEAVAGTPRASGLLPMPSVVIVGTPVRHGGVNSWFPYNSNVAYRSVLRKPTANGTSLLSPPSARCVIANRCLVPVGGLVRTGGTTVTGTLAGGSIPPFSAGDTFVLSPGEANFAAGTYTVATHVAGTNVFTYADAGANVASTLAEECNSGAGYVIAVATLSADATVSTPVRLYRSAPTSASTIEPSDEMFLVNEVFPSAGDITLGFIAIIDNTPVSQAVDPLYTNPLTSGGIAAESNNRAPIYRDLANWGGRLWAFNLTYRQELRMQMLGVGAVDGVQNNDTLTIDSEVFTFKTTPAGANDVQIYTDGVPSINISRTTQKLITVVNVAMATASKSIRAYSAAQQGDPDGSFLLQRNDYGLTTFTVAASRVLSWTPALTATSDNNRQPAGLVYSKPAEPESFPPLNFTSPVGAKNHNGSRLFGLRNALIACKEGDGIYSVTGSAPNFNVQQISTANIVAPDCAAVFSDNAWVYTDQGILRISDSGGAQVVSRQIETDLNALYALYPSDTFSLSFAVPYEVERRIMFYVPVAEDGNGAPILKAFSYSNATQSWTNYNKAAFSGLVMPDRKLYLGVNDSTWGTTRILKERKGSVPSYLDKADEQWAVTITEVRTINLGGVLHYCVQFADETGIGVGDGFTQLDFAHSTSTVFRHKIKLLRPDLGYGWTEVYENTEGLSGNTTQMHKHYDVEAQFLPTGDPVRRKSLSRLTWVMKLDSFANYAGKTTVFSDQQQAEQEIATSYTGFGLSGFGAGGFGQASPLAVDVNPINASDGAQFFFGYKTSEVWVKMRLEGYGAQIDGASGPAGRGK